MFHYRAPIADATMHGTGIDTCILTMPAMLGYALAKHYLQRVDMNELVTSVSHCLQAGAAPCVQLAWDAKALMGYMLAERNKLMQERSALHTRVVELQAKDLHHQSSRKRLKQDNDVKQAKQQLDTESDDSSHDDYRAEEESPIVEDIPQLEEESQTTTIVLEDGDDEDDSEIEEIVVVPAKQVKVGDFIKLKRRVWSPYGQVGRVVEINEAQLRYRIQFNFAWNPKLWCREEDLLSYHSSSL